MEEKSNAYTTAVRRVESDNLEAQEELEF
jgi:hypothetical protein